MRKLLLTLCFLGLAGPAQAQTFARAHVNAVVRVPEFLSMRVGETMSVSSTSRRVTVYVTANRLWQLSLASVCSGCTVKMESVGRAGSRLLEGSNGNEIPVVVEYKWQEGQPAPEPRSLEYVLTPA